MADTATSGTEAGAVSRPGPALLALLAALAAVGLLLMGAAAGMLAAREPAPPGDTSAEAGFARDMSVHHGQAVEMAMALYPRTADPVLQAVAGDIALTQQAQIGRMQAWLAEWGLAPTGTQARMAWMAEAGGEHAAHALLPDGRMPGMASGEEIAALRTLPVPQAEAQFLRLMVDHHLAGVDMAEAGLAVLEEPETRALAENVVASQTSEVEVLRDLLAARGQAATGQSATGQSATGATATGETGGGGHQHG